MAENSSSSRTRTSNPTAPRPYRSPGVRAVREVGHLAGNPVRTNAQRAIESTDARDGPCLARDFTHRNRSGRGAAVARIWSPSHSLSPRSRHIVPQAHQTVRSRQAACRQPTSWRSHWRAPNARRRHTREWSLTATCPYWQHEPVECAATRWRGSLRRKRNGWRSAGPLPGSRRVATLVRCGRPLNSL